MGNADLHIHSTMSDGLLSPEDIVNWGVKKGLTAISITDHDSISGIECAADYSKDKNIEVVPGIEMSTEYNNVEVHMLGYFIDYKSSLLCGMLEKLKMSRVERAKLMIKKLNDLGINITIDYIHEIARNAQSVGRPHIARALIKLGYCSSIEEAFDKYIGYNKPAYVERYKLSPFEALEIILNSGGAASIAHPGLIINIDRLLLIKKLKGWGLSGIEVYHTKHTNEDVVYFSSIAEKLNLIPTGGSDCHGLMENSGPILGSVTVPYESVKKLKNASAAYRG